MIFDSWRLKTEYLRRLDTDLRGREDSGHHGAALPRGSSGWLGTSE